MPISRGIPTLRQSRPKRRSVCIFKAVTESCCPSRSTSGVFKGGGGGATAPPLWPDHKFFWLILQCFVGFISRLNRINSVSRGMDVCVIALYRRPCQTRGLILVTCPCLQLRRVVTAGELQQMDCSKRCSS